MDNKENRMPPWTYRIVEPDEKTGIVCVRMLVSSLPSQGSATESVEAFVEVPWSGGDEQAIRRAALSRLDKLVRAEIERVGGQ
ncbi:MAG: hypothetical protein WAM17_12210 [Rhodoplanes sp.]